MKEIDIKDKILGCWYGKCIGGNAGAKFEGCKDALDFRDIKDLPHINIANDDLEIQLVWMYVIRERGGDIDGKVLGEGWLRHIYAPWCEYKVARRNLERKIYPPLSGLIDNEFFGESMGCPIRSEIWGLVCAGDPEKAGAFARMDGSIDHFGFSVDAEAFLSAWLSLIINDKEPDIFKHADRAATIAGGEIPDFYNTIKDWCNKRHDWLWVRRQILSMYPSVDVTSARINVGFIIASLFLGKGDFKNTLLYAINMGYDTDCTAATAMAILGAAKGASSMGDELKALTGKEIVISSYIKDIEYPSTILELAEQTLEIQRLLKKKDKPALDRIIGYVEVPSWKWKIFGPYYEGPQYTDRDKSSNLPYEHGEKIELPPFIHMFGTTYPSEMPLVTLQSSKGDDYIEIASIGDMVGLPLSLRHCVGKWRIVATRQIRIKDYGDYFISVSFAGRVKIFIDNKDITSTDKIGIGWALEHLALWKDVSPGIHQLAIVMDSEGGKVMSYTCSIYKSTGNHPHNEFYYVEEPETYIGVNSEIFYTN